MNALKEAANNSITNMPLPGVASLCVFIGGVYARR